jgi:hypothetical protein
MNSLIFDKWTEEDQRKLNQAKDEVFKLEMKKRRCQQDCGAGWHSKGSKLKAYFNPHGR